MDIIILIITMLFLTVCHEMLHYIALPERIRHDKENPPSINFGCGKLLFKIGKANFRLLPEIDFRLLPISSYVEVKEHRFNRLTSIERNIFYSAPLIIPTTWLSILFIMDMIYHTLLLSNLIVFYTKMLLVYYLPIPDSDVYNILNIKETWTEDSLWIRGLIKLIGLLFIFVYTSVCIYQFIV